MQRTLLGLSTVLFLIPALPANAEIIKGVMSIKGAEMP
jgi:hypothetical protein